MATRKLTELSVEITGDASGLSRAMAKASQDVREGGDKIIEKTREISKEFTGIGVGLTAVGFAAALKEAINYGDELRDMARAVGASVEQLSFLDYAAKQSGTNLEDLTSSVSRLQRNLGELAAGRGEGVREALQKLKIDPQDLFKADLVTQIEKIGTALNGIENPALRAAAGQALLGKGFKSIASLALEGETGIRQLVDRFVELDAAVTTEQATRFDSLNDSLGNLKTASAGAARAIADEVAPAFTKFFGDIASGVPKAGQFLRDLGGFLADSMLEAQRAIAKADLAILEFLQKTAGRVGFDQSAKIDAQKAKIEELNRALAEAEADEAERLRKSDERRAKLRADIGKQPPAAPVEIKETPEAIRKREAAAAKAAADAERDRKQALQESADVENYLSDVVKERAKVFADAQDKIRKDAAAVYEATRTPLERYTEEVRRLLSLPLDDDTLARGISKARDELQKSEDQGKKTDDVMRRLGITFTSAFEEAIVKGGELSDVISGLGEDIKRLAVREFITEPFSKAFDEIASKGKDGGLSGILGDLFKSSGIGDFFGGLFKNAKGGLYQVGGSGSEHPVAFTARAGEIVAVGTPGGGSAGGGVSIVINNNSGANVSAQDQGVVSGRRQISVLVESAVGDIMGSGRGRRLGFAPPVVSR